MKTCTTCQQAKGHEEFHRRSANADGRRSECKQCVSVYGRERYAANPEPAKARAKKWQAENPERTKELAAARRWAATVRRWKADGVRRGC